MPIATRRESIRNKVPIHHTNANSSIPQVLSDIYCGSSHRNMTTRTTQIQYKLFGEAFQISKWPASSNVHCWHCRLQFDTIPCSLPWHYDEQQQTFCLKGIFCSWSCAKRYCLDQQHYNASSIIANMKMLAIKHFSHPIAKKIQPAPPYTALNIFGGPMTTEQFKACLATSKQIKNIEKPFYNFPSAISIEEEQLHHLGQLKGLRKPTQEVTTTEHMTNTAQSSMYQHFIKNHEQSSKKRKVRQTSSSTSKKRTGSLARFIKKKKV